MEGKKVWCVTYRADANEKSSCRVYGNITAAIKAYMVAQALYNYADLSPQLVQHSYSDPKAEDFVKSKWGIDDAE